MVSPRKKKPLRSFRLRIELVLRGGKRMTIVDMPLVEFLYQTVSRPGSLILRRRLKFSLAEFPRPGGQTEFFEIE